jgi:hypothetical protein
MGLALHNPAHSLSDLGSTRHLGPDPDRSKVYSTRSRQYLFKGCVGNPLPEYKLPLIELARREDPRYRVDRSRQLHRTRTRWGLERSEGEALARSDVALPSDGHVFRRRPSLERQEAFRDETTSKRNSFRLSSSVNTRPTSSPGEDEAIAELYRLGVLYDDEHVRGEAFNFNTIIHDEAPAYALRPSRGRGRKVNRARGLDEDFDPEPALTLDLSMAQLSQDEAIARFLIGPSVSETRSVWQIFGEVEEKLRSEPMFSQRAKNSVSPSVAQEILEELFSSLSENEDDDGEDMNDNDNDSDDADNDPSAEDDNSPELESDFNEDSTSHNTNKNDICEVSRFNDDTNFLSDCNNNPDEDNDWAVLPLDQEVEAEDDDCEGNAASSDAGAWIVLGDGS